MTVYVMWVELGYSHFREKHMGEFYVSIFLSSRIGH